MHEPTQKNESLIAALRKAEAAKFAAVPPEEAVEHRFSDRFQKRMDRLIRFQRLSVWQLVRTPQRRAALLLLFLLLTFGVRPDQNPLFRYTQLSLPMHTVVLPPVQTGTRPLPSEQAPPRAVKPAPAPTRETREDPTLPEKPTYAETPAALPAQSAASTAPSGVPSYSEAPSAAPDVPEEDETPAEEQATERPDGYPAYVPIGGADETPTEASPADDDWAFSLQPPSYDFTVSWETAKYTYEPAAEETPEYPVVQIFY